MLTQALIADADAFGGRDRLGSGLLLKALCRAVQAAVAAYGEALKSRDHPRPQDNDGTTSKDPLVGLTQKIRSGVEEVILGSLRPNMPE